MSDVDYIIDWYDYRKDPASLQIFSYKIDVGVNHKVSNLEEELDQQRKTVNSKITKKIAKLQAKLDYNNALTVNALIEQANAKAQQEQEDRQNMANLKIEAAKADIVFWESKLK